MSSVETGQMSPVATIQMTAAETGQMSAVETRQMLKSGRASQEQWGLSKARPSQILADQSSTRGQNIKFGPKWVENRRFGLKLGPNES